MIKRLRSESINETLLVFLLGHCYGFYFQQILVDHHPEIYRDPDAVLDIAFSNRRPSEETKRREVIYFVPELGKNIFPLKLWIPQRLKKDLGLLAEHADLSLSAYLREIVIARLFGHGMLPMRPEMLKVADTSLAESWCEDGEVPWTEISREVYVESTAGRTETREISDQDPQGD